MEPIVKTAELSNQVKLPYAEQGDPSGVPVLLLHAIADSWHTFKVLLAHLPDHIHAFALTQRAMVMRAVPGQVTVSMISQPIWQCL